VSSNARSPSLSTRRSKTYLKTNDEAAIDDGSTDERRDTAGPIRNREPARGCLSLLE
jgi:hypothetical protein